VARAVFARLHDLHAPASVLAPTPPSPAGSGA
jgi:hypothetical protein